MIILKLTGGLGNQMFQYAAGISLAEQHGTILKLDVSNYTRSVINTLHERYALSCFSIAEHFATESEILRYKILKRKEHSIFRLGRFILNACNNARLVEFVHGIAPTVKSFNEHTLRFDPSFFSLPKSSYIMGLWQTEKYFLQIAELIRSYYTFRYPASFAARNMMDKISRTNSVSIHFRRGDYVQDSHYSAMLGCVPMDYYYNAIALLSKILGNFTLFVFSDDLDYIRSNFHPELEIVYVEATGPKAASDDMRLMSHCQHNIISNSSFSWWAAWLNQNPEKIVVTPTPWFADTSRDSADIVPDSWIKVNRL